MGKFGTNVFQVNIYKKVSNLDEPFWGLTKNRLDQLAADAQDYCVQFDYPDGSIVLTSAQVSQLVKNKNVATDGDYKISLSDIEQVLPL